MKGKSLFMAILIGGSLLSCNTTPGESETGRKEKSEIIGKANPKIENGVMTPEVLHGFGRVGSFEVSPDKIGRASCRERV